MREIAETDPNGYTHAFLTYDLLSIIISISFSGLDIFSFAMLDLSGPGDYFVSE